ncbi:hypothetical protein SPFL3102_00611 [Sporomusaceae bacterium FL31]|nr:hypothetical protein SPFL3101_01340 [Sporomusaceae bacterium FL31]GCE32814.1 hypothetical protein SPFL3102_00611 [Sporomusaceae bacterium]
MTKSKFYGVYGTNAYAVFTSWNRVEQARKYFRKFSVKSFKTFQEAEEFAFDGFCDGIFGVSPFFYGVFPKKLIPNNIIFKKKLLDETAE